MHRLWSDTEGAALLEFSIFALFFFSLLFGVIEFTFAYYQWNAATKAVQYGARLAAVSNPVPAALSTWTGTSGSVAPKDPMPAFSVTCQGASADGSTGTCTCTGLACTYDATWSPAAMRRIVFGKSNRTSCVGARPIGMCHLFYRITPANVIVRYNGTGLGFAGRPAVRYSSDKDKKTSHAVPTISVEVTGIEFQFLFLSGFAGLDPIDMPGLLSTVTGEDMRSH